MPDMKKLTIGGVTYNVKDSTAAPAGYGLGGVGEVLPDGSDLDTVFANGWYRVTQGYNIANSPYSAGVVLVMNYDGRYATQVFFRESTDKNSIKIRVRGDGWGVWDDWSPSAFAPATHTHDYAGIKQVSADLNTTITAGFYGTNSSTANLPESRFAYAALLVEVRGASIFQTLTEAAWSGNIVQIKRYSTDSGTTWTEWCWVNPVMVIGTEYRTTELYTNKPVYTMLVNCGTMPSATTKGIEHGVSATKILRVCGTTSGGIAIPWIDGNSRVEIGATRATISVTTNLDMTHSTLTAQIWYIK